MLYKALDMASVGTILGSSAIIGQAIAILLFSYLLGCFITGYYYIRFRTGQDIHELGSGNVGAKNVGRIAGPWGFAVTLLGDAGKSALAVGLAGHFTGNLWLMMLAATGAMLGHLWPAQLGLRGGKGMNTSLGAILVFDYRSVLVFAALTTVAYLMLRSSVLSGLLAFALVPVVCLLRGTETATTVGVVCLAALTLLAHRRNLIEELAGFSARHHNNSNPDPPTKQP